MHPKIPREIFDRIARLDSCAVSNAIETFGVRLRNEGFSEAGAVCRFPGFPPMLGYAATLHVRASSPPPNGRAYPDRSDWWDRLEAIPSPRVLVIQDVDYQPGAGAFVGEVHASIFKALGCVGAVTNGAARDLPALRDIGFQLFSGGLSVSHAYVHVVEFGTPVVIGGLEINQGDLLHGDQHGLVRIPLEIAEKIPHAAEELRGREKRITAFCRSSSFSTAGLRELLREETAAEG